MLPSTGKFKEMTCPFFDSGLCERPYCHFRHVRKESFDSLQTQASAVNSVNFALSLADNNDILHLLVSEAVKKVLEKTDLPIPNTIEANTLERVTHNLVSKVTEVLTPLTPPAASAISQKHRSASTSSQKVPSYRPTPIAVLKNRHVPVPHSLSLIKTSSIIRKRDSSYDSTVFQRKLKNPVIEESNKFSSLFPSTTSPITSKILMSSNVIKVDRVSVSDAKAYSSCEYNGSVYGTSANSAAAYSASANSAGMYSASATSAGASSACGSNASTSCASVSSTSMSCATASHVSISDSACYSPAPVGVWKDSGRNYTSSAIETLEPNTYVPSCGSTSQQAVTKYESSEKSKIAVKVICESLITNGSPLGEASYEQSRMSNSEFEYRPLSCDNTVKEYVPTGMLSFETIANTDLNIRPEIDHQYLLHDDINAKDSEDIDKKKVDITGKYDSSGSEVRFKQPGCGPKSSTTDEKSENNCEKHKCDIIKKTSNSNRKKRYDKRPSEIVRKNDFKKHSVSDAKSNNSKNRGVIDKEHSKTSSCGGRKRTKIDEKRYESDKQGNERRRKSEKCEETHNGGEKTKSDADEKTSSAVKHNESRRKNSESDNKRGETEKKRSEHELRKGKNEGKGKVSFKNCSNVEDSSSTQDSKHNIKNSRANSGIKSSEQNSIMKRAVHKKSSNNLFNDKMTDDMRLSHKEAISGHNSSNSAQECSEGKAPKTEDYSKSKNVNSKRRRSDSVDHLENNKTKVCNKHSKPEKNKRLQEDVSFDDVNYGHSLSDSETSDIVDILDNATLLSGTIASISSDEETVTKECYRIFQEYQPSNASKKPTPMNELPTQEKNYSIAHGKRRVAHEGAQNCKLSRQVLKRSSGSNPSQILSQRFQKIRENRTQYLAHSQVQSQISAKIAHRAQTALGKHPSMSRRMNVIFPVTQSNSMANIPHAKKRIAPNTSVLLDAKMKMQQKLKEHQLNTYAAGHLLEITTKAQTVPKGSQRVAHVPSEQVLMRPIVKDIGGKIPSNVRQNYLNILVNEYFKISGSEQEAFQKAEKEERTIYSRSTTRALYVSRVSSTINRLRKADQSNNAPTSGKTDGKLVNRTVSHTSMLIGKVGAKGSWSIEKPRKPPLGVVNKSLYELLSQFIMTDEELKLNGFPTSHVDEKGVAVIHSFYKKPYVPKTPQQRMCVRCSKTYYVNQQGRAVKEEFCIYHWGRLFQSKTRDGWEARYNCCQGHDEAIGCSVGSCHVSDNFDPNNLRGFVRTLPKERAPPDGDYGVYALDCEMCYTTLGLELTRMTVVGSDLKVVYETFVRPENCVLDYNTRFSGIKEEDLENVTTNIYEVQSVLLSFINDKTILVGHSLESDFKALKLIHSTVVDTSVVYPHKMGPPKKRALKTLCRDLLQKIIQENESGHNSAEDARAAMEIMLFKVKEDLKT